MRFPDDKDKENQENINGAECERKQGNDDIRHCNDKLRYSVGPIGNISIMFLHKAVT